MAIHIKLNKCIALDCRVPPLQSAECGQPGAWVLAPVAIHYPANVTSTTRLLVLCCTLTTDEATFVLCRGDVGWNMWPLRRG